MTFSEGDLIVKILNRASMLAGVPAEEGAEGGPSSTRKLFTLPQKNKIFVEQAYREQKDPKSEWLAIR